MHKAVKSGAIESVYSLNAKLFCTTWERIVVAILAYQSILSLLDKKCTFLFLAEEAMKKCSDPCTSSPFGMN